MESHSCKLLNFNDIRVLIIKQGIIVMNALKKAFVGAGIAAASLLPLKNAEAQQLARNDNPAPARTELAGTFAGNADKTKKANPETNPKKAAAIIKQGHGGQANFYSLKNENIFVLYVSGGTKGINGEPQEAYTAAKYAQLLQNEFAKYGEYVAVFYEETGKDRPTGVEVLKDGKTRDLTTGMFIYDPKESFTHPFVFHGEIPKIVKDNAAPAPAVAFN